MWKEGEGDSRAVDGLTACFDGDGCLTPVWCTDDILLSLTTLMSGTQSFNCKDTGRKSSGNTSIFNSTCFWHFFSSALLFHSGLFHLNINCSYNHSGSSKV